MIHYHGTPIGGTREEVTRFAHGRHFLIPWPRPEDLGTVADVCESFIFDNGAYTFWRQGESVKDWRPYFEFVKLWVRHPRYAYAMIPDEIEGDEEANDRLICKWVNWQGWRGQNWWNNGVPVWHLHESLERLERLVRGWQRVAFGSSGQWMTPGTESWHRRMNEAMRVACDDDGRPRCKLYGLRMLRGDIVARYPFAGADSTNVAQNANNLNRFGMYAPPTRSQRCEAIASRIEAVVSPAVYAFDRQQELVFSEAG